MFLSWHLEIVQKTKKKREKGLKTRKIVLRLQKIKDGKVMKRKFWRNIQPEIQISHDNYCITWSCLSLQAEQNESNNNQGNGWSPFLCLIWHIDDVISCLSKSTYFPTWVPIVSDVGLANSALTDVGLAELLHDAPWVYPQRPQLWVEPKALGGHWSRSLHLLSTKH